MGWVGRQVRRWFIPPALQRDPRQELLTLRAVLLGFAIFFWAPVFAPVYYALGSPRSAVMIILAAVAFALTLASLHITRSVFTTGHLIAGVVFFTLIALAMVTGGIQATSLTWLPAVSIISLVVCGIPSGLAWTAVSCLACFVFHVLAQLGVELPSDIEPTSLLWLDWSAVTGIILCAFTLTLVFKLGEDAARRALEAARFESDLANRAKSAFLANMSHEIRTPMNAVIGMTELVLGTELSRQQREYLTVVQDSSESLLALLNDILDFSKIEAGKLQLEPRPFDLRESLGDTLKLLGTQAHAKGLELVCSIDRSVPAVLIGDQVRLRQIIVNLVGNAIKFTLRGEVVLRVHGGQPSDANATLEFTVSDTGIGIPPDKLEVIFGVFEQADMTTTRRFGGTGLGLAICKRLVEMMGGRISVASQLDQGSTFRFTVPFGIASPEPAARGAGSLPEVENVPVLVVDDNPTNRQMLEQTLRGWGMVPTLVGEAHQALGLLHHAHKTGEPYRLVLTDAHMPEMDGFMLAQQIREDPELRSLVVMMLTSGDHPGDIARCEQLGLASYLLKPIKQSELFKAILDALGGRSLPPSGTPPKLPEALAARGLEVLLAEDSLVNQKLATAVLTKMGHRVTVAGNGRDAVAAWEAGHFDVVLMDIQMPEMDGFEATQTIRSREQQRGNHTPIIAMTAHALKGDRERCLEGGMDGYLSKPIRSQQLAELLTELVPAMGSAQSP